MNEDHDADPPPRQTPAVALALTFAPRTGNPMHLPVCSADCKGRPIEERDCFTAFKLMPGDRLTLLEHRGDNRTLLCTHPAVTDQCGGVLIVDLFDTAPAKL
jgi:hypothetical protein